LKTNETSTTLGLSKMSRKDYGGGKKGANHPSHQELREDANGDTFGGTVPYKEIEIFSRIKKDKREMWTMAAGGSGQRFCAPK